MDFNNGQLISRNIVHEIPVTDVVIKAVENMASQQGFKRLKFKNRKRVIYQDANWIEGVNYDDPVDYDPDDIENEDEEYDKKEDEHEDQLEQYKQIEINSNKSILKRSKTSSELQEKKPIQTCMYQTITPMRNNWNIQ
jgi:hypothetical protein